MFLPYLAASLNNLSNRQSDNGDDSASGAMAFEKVIDSMVDPLTRAELRAAHARWCGANGEAAHASRSLGVGAAQAADGEPTALGRARRELRSAFAAIGLEGPRLPLWMTSEPTEIAVAAINALAEVGEPSTLAERIAEHRETISGDAFVADLEVFEALFPRSDELAQVRRIVQACLEHGVNALLADLRRQSELDAIIAEWVATESWPASKQFLAEHPRLTQPDIAEALAAMQTAVAALHAGILHLTARLGIDTAYDIVTDPAAGLPRIDTAIRTADEQTLIAILQASQHLNRVPFAAGLAAATILTMRGQPDDAVAQLKRVVATSSPNQRKAASITLQALARSRQELSTTVDRLRVLLT